MHHIPEEKNTHILYIVIGNALPKSEFINNLAQLCVDSIIMYVLTCVHKHNITGKSLERLN